MPLCSTLVFAQGSFPKFLERFCHHIGGRWQSYQVLIGEDWFPQQAERIVIPARIPRDDEGVFFCRNKKMDCWWETHGFEPMPNGEGPFGIAFGTRKNIVLGLRPTPRWVKAGTKLNYDLYVAGCALAVPRLLCLNFATPGIPGQCEFSTWVMDCGFAAALGRPDLSGED
jgi:hypothetical protein